MAASRRSLALRELVLGTRLFSDFQRALSRISPTLLVKRLNQLQEAGVIVKKRRLQGRAYDYYLSCFEGGGHAQFEQ